MIHYEWQEYNKNKRPRWIRHTAMSHDQLEVPSFKLFTPLGQLTVSHRDT